ncbi:serine protease inhibitor dipetalogastin-like isoform X1 [Helicoverpa zea]|uniref:serine protease inhibitor dipetalogastin-like isoform X1 n=1 Tax=Helicoverpa zea TaxID=7113 RepID=UPI001F5A1635|nr:serine protease inhibitor dipetalogastin-like isoform X1 [Helicoverpa zea]
MRQINTFNKKGILMCAHMCIALGYSGEENSDENGEAESEGDIDTEDWGEQTDDEGGEQTDDDGGEQTDDDGGEQTDDDEGEQTDDDGGEEEHHGCICAHYYEPLCGSNGETYYNRCVFQCALRYINPELIIKHFGMCNSDDHSGYQHRHGRRVSFLF